MRRNAMPVYARQGEDFGGMMRELDKAIDVWVSEYHSDFQKHRRASPGEPPLESWASEDALLDTAVEDAALMTALGKELRKRFLKRARPD